MCWRATSGPRGFNVLHPMGWDAFGLPAENAAMQNKVHPKAWTYANIDAMRRQLKSIGLSFDWTREIATCDVEYYAQQQKLFLDMLREGLVARRKSKVNWDPVDMTVLANEQVVDGRGWRSGAVVEQRELNQWAFKVSDYAEDLLSALDGLDQWPDKVRLMQHNWIGKSEGMRLLFELTEEVGDFASIEVFTTRPDTIFGASFIAISADHPLAKAVSDRPDIAAFIAETHRQGTATETIDKAEKLGVFTGVARETSGEARRHAAGLRRQFRADGVRRRRHFRLPARMISATSISPAATACPWCRWCCPTAPIPRASRSTPRPTPARAGSSTPSSSTGWRSRRPRRRSLSILAHALSATGRRAWSR